MSSPPLTLATGRTFQLDGGKPGNRTQCQGKRKRGRQTRWARRAANREKTVLGNQKSPQHPDTRTHTTNEACRLERGELRRRRMTSRQLTASIAFCAADDLCVSMDIYFTFFLVFDLADTSARAASGSTHEKRNGCGVREGAKGQTERRTIIKVT